MSLKKTLTRLALIAALVSGAAIATSAQKRKPAATTRKQTAAQTTQVAPAEPAPAKKNVRSDDAVAPQSSAAETSAPAKNAGARPAAGQSTDPGAASKGGEKSAADEVSYTYQFAQPEFDVRRVVIEHDAAGRGRITFERKNEEQPLTEPLDISPSAFARIVSAWEGLKFLDSAESYQADKQFPHLGTYRLRMKRGTRERATEFNWTHNEQASALIREYRRLTEQQLFVFDIAVARQYQPTESVKVLRRLEILLDRDDISDKSTLAPLLGDLVNDERIPLIARNQAARLLKRIAK
jgi:hypothetical protein